MVAGEEEVSAPRLWRLSYPGGEARRITNDLHRDNDVSLTGDSRSLVTVQTNRASNIWVAPEGDAARARQVTAGTSDSSLGLAWTPDGKYVAGFYMDERANPQQGVMILPAAGGEPAKRFDILPDAVNGFALHWSPDGRALLHLRDDLPNIWSQPVDGGKPTPATNFQGDQIFNFAWSHDGKRLALARGRVTDDVVLISDAR
jgi:Tol biopolymer transport system component